MQQNHKLVLTQKQELKLSPQLYQSIQLMAMPLQELRDRIKEEIEKNPALEQAEKNEVTQSDIGENKADDHDYFENSSDPGYTLKGNSHNSSEDTKRKFLEGAVYREESLKEHLLSQFNLIPLSEKEMELGRSLISNLDSNGFHQEPPSLFLGKCDESDLESVIAHIQSLDPIGCCCENYAESLVVQSKTKGYCPDDFENFVYNILPKMEKKKSEVVQKESGYDEEEFEDFILFMQTLHPYPGRLYSSETPHFVVPDLMIKKEEGKLAIYLNDFQIPELMIDDYFEELEETPPKDKETKNFVKNHTKNARWFINSILQRNSTLLKTAKAIAKFQKNFFYEGAKALGPLTLKDIAKEIDVHEATVSRITTNKYVQTEWGIYELKYFFTNSISSSSSDGKSFSKVAVKEILRELIENAPTEKRLSDQKLSDLLDKKGIKLARRTVAKYRKELQIDSSLER